MLLAQIYTVNISAAYANIAKLNILHLSKLVQIKKALKHNVLVL